jgi:hypothetical protein
MRLLAAIFFGAALFIWACGEGPAALLMFCAAGVIYLSCNHE